MRKADLLTILYGVKVGVGLCSKLTIRQNRLLQPGQWEQSKNLIYTGAGIWAGLVIITGVANSFIT